MTVVKHGVSTDTPDRLLIDAGAVYIGFGDADSPGTLLGATRGGNVFELARTVRRMEADGMRGPVKGFRRIEDVVAKLTVNLLEMTAENLRRAIAGAIYSSGTTLVEDEAVGTGDGIETDFALDHGAVEENSESVTVNAVAQVRGTNYAIDYQAGTLQFFTAPGDTLAIVATYTYVSGDGVMGGETTEASKYRIKDTAFIDNVTLVGTLTGYTDPVIITITRALCDAGLNLKLAPKDEMVTEIVFTAHYSNADLDAEPWSVTYPAT